MRSRIGFVHHHFCEFQIFRFRPEQHFTVFLLAHTASLLAGVFSEVVILDLMIEDGAELIVDGFEIYGRKGLAFLVLIVHQLVLPCDDLLGGNAAHLQLTEIRDELGADDVFLGCPSVFLDAGFHICGVLLEEALKCHIEVGAYLVELFTLPRLCLSLGFEATLLRLLLLTRPIGEAVNRTPGVRFFFLVNCHIITSFFLFRSQTFH